MKQKALLITAAVFFLLVNTSYVWERKLEPFAFPLTIFLVIVFLVLVVLFLQQVFFALTEKFANNQRLLVTGILATILGFTYFKPNGLINFDALQGNNLLVAQREGAANCTTTLKIKEDNSFIETSVCFGLAETKGSYQLKGDTLFFKNIQLARHQNQYYMFAIIKQTTLTMYKNYADTSALQLYITKNQLTN